jgi:hypothetical protein
MLFLTRFSLFAAIALSWASSCCGVPSIFDFRLQLHKRDLANDLMSGITPGECRAGEE